MAYSANIVYDSVYFYYNKSLYKSKRLYNELPEYIKNCIATFLKDNGHIIVIKYKGTEKYAIISNIDEKNVTEQTNSISFKNSICTVFEEENCEWKKTNDSKDDYKLSIVTHIVIDDSDNMCTFI